MREKVVVKQKDLPIRNSDIPTHLQRTILRKIRNGEDKGVDEEKFREALDRAIETEPCDPKE